MNPNKKVVYGSTRLKDQDQTVNLFSGLVLVRDMETELLIFGVFGWRMRVKVDILNGAENSFFLLTHTKQTNSLANNTSLFQPY